VRRSSSLRQRFGRRDAGDPAVSHLEPREQLGKLFDLSRQGVTGDIGLLDHGGVLLHALIHLNHRDINLIEARRLFLRRCGYLRRRGIYLCDLGGDTRQGRTGLADDPNATVDLLC
jgi:hypothetical protein